MKKDDVSKAKFLQKYRGLEFNDIDHPEVHLRICDQDMKFRRRLKTDLGGWTVVTYNENDETDTWRIEPGCPLHDCLATYYDKHPEKNVKVVLRKEQKDDFDWLIAQQQKKTAEDSSTSASDTVTSCDSAPKTS
ncbi:hypothetical protein G9A89_000607, partial [Geosiphon pyriformis]